MSEFVGTGKNVMEEKLSYSYEIVFILQIEKVQASCNNTF